MLPLQLVTIPYHFPRHLIKVQQEHLAIIYSSCPVSSEEALTRETVLEEENQFTTAIAAHSRLTSDFEIQVLLGLHHSLSVLPLPDLLLTHCCTFQSSHL